jgi:hypothetical protein
MPNQFSFTRSQIKRWAKGEDGGFTPERIAAIEAAAKKGNVTRDGESSESPPEPKPPPQAAGTEIRGSDRLPVRSPRWLR